MPNQSNIESLHQRFIDAGRAGLSLDEIVAEFGWHPEIARNAIATVRSRYSVGIIYDGRSSTYRLLDYSTREIDAAIAMAAEDVAESAPEVPQSMHMPPSARDTRETILAALRAVAGFQDYEWDSWLTRHISGSCDASVRGVRTPSPMSQLLLTDNSFNGVRDRVREWLMNERALLARTVQPSALEPIEAIAQILNDLDAARPNTTSAAGITFWVNWLNRRVTGNRRYTPVEEFVPWLTEPNTRERVLNWITRSRVATLPTTNSDTLLGLAGELSDIDRSTRMYWANYLEQLSVGSLANCGFEDIINSSRFDEIRPRVWAWIEYTRVHGLAPTDTADIAINDSLWRGIAPEVAIYYRERSLELQQ